MIKKYASSENTLLHLILKELPIKDTNTSIVGNLLQTSLFIGRNLYRIKLKIIHCFLSAIFENQAPKS